MLSRQWAVLVSAVFFAPLVLADQVVLDNGDRVTGQIVKKDGDSLSIKSALMGDITVKWEHVASVTTDQPVTVVLPGNQAVQGKVTTTDKQIQVAAATGSQAAPLTAVQAMRDAHEQATYERLLRPPFYDLWSGYLDFGFAGAQGNARTLSFTTSLNANRVTRRDRTSVYFNQIYSRGRVGDTLAITAKAWRGGWSYNHDIGGRAFLNVFNDYENDAFQNLKLRFVAGGGAGFHLIKHERAVLDVLGGGSYNHEHFGVPLTGTTDHDTRQAGEAYWGDDFIYKLSGRSNFKQSFRMFNNLSVLGEYRVNMDIETDTRITKWLSWQITGSDRYLTNPAPGRKTNDLLLSSGIRLSFSRLPH